MNSPSPPLPKRLRAKSSFVVVIVACVAGVVVGAIAAGCTDQSELDACAGADQCLRDTAFSATCLSGCVELDRCCECLADNDCIELDEDTCFQEIDEGGSIQVQRGCIDDDDGDDEDGGGPCAAFCGEILTQLVF